MTAKIKAEARKFVTMYRVNLLASEPAIEYRNGCYTTDLMVFWQVREKQGGYYTKRERRTAAGYRWFESFEEAKNFLIARAQAEKQKAMEALSVADRNLMLAATLNEPVPAGDW